MCVYADLRLAGVIRANSPIHRVTRRVMTEDPTVRTSMDRRRHKTALSTRHRRDFLLDMAEARAMCLLVDSSPLVMETVRDMNPRAGAQLPVTTTRMRLVRYVL